MATTTAAVLKTLFSGAIFGSALTVSGVYQPWVITSQMQLRDFHMLKVFLTASATSALVLAYLNSRKRIQASPRSPSPLGILGLYDGNVVGGLLVGVGMMLTGACPGTVLVQVATGVTSGYAAFAGGILGGIVWSRIAPFTKRNASCRSDLDNLTIQKIAGLDDRIMLVTYEALCTAVVGLLTLLMPANADISTPAIIGGLLVGGGQLASCVLRGSPVGMSATYEEIGRHFWAAAEYRVRNQAKEKNTAFPSAITFAIGVAMASCVLAQLQPSFAPTLPLQISSKRGLLGGFIMVLGARIAGGCPSGHGITGMSLLSVSSVVSVASMFAGGIGLARLL